MNHPSSLSHPSDMCLLLRAYAEQRWIAGELLPVVRELESPEQVPEEQLGAALAYLEVLWVDARRRASETDAALEALGAGAGYSPVLCRTGTPLPRGRAAPEGFGGGARAAHHPLGSPPSPRERAGL